MAAKPCQPSGCAGLGPNPGTRGEASQDAALKKSTLSMEGAPDGALAVSSRSRLRIISASRGCVGQTRSDPQAGAGSHAARQARQKVRQWRTTGGRKRLRRPSEAKQTNFVNRKPACQPWPLRRRESAGCSIVRLTGGNSFRAGGARGNRKARAGETRSHRERTRHGCS